MPHVLRCTQMLQSRVHVCKASTVGPFGGDPSKEALKVYKETQRCSVLGSGAWQAARVVCAPNNMPELTRATSSSIATSIFGLSSRGGTPER